MRHETTATLDPRKSVIIYWSIYKNGQKVFSNRKQWKTFFSVAAAESWANTMMDIHMKEGTEFRVSYEQR